MQVIRLTLNDKELVHKCDELLVSFCKEQEKYDSNYITIENMGSFLKDLDNDDKFVLCMENDKNVLGFLYGYIENKKNMKKRVANLTFIYVKNEFRKQNIATRLITEYINMLKENDIQIIEVKSYNNNEAANSLYSKFGFNALWTNYRMGI